MKRIAALCALLAAGCYGGGADGEGFALRNPDDRGPNIVWDLEAEPLPEIPFPNDIGTRSDLGSATGRRVNISENAITAHESRLRHQVNRLEGFGTFAPIWIRFDGRIDLLAFFEEMTDGDPLNDPAYLIDVDPGSPGYGERVPLDTGSGPPDFGPARFPVTIQKNDNYFNFDPRAETSNLLFETVEEDLNGDGVLQEEEDTDADGTLDHPNLWGTILKDDRLLDPYRHLITFYELESDTLLLRPAVPLRQTTTYAAVLTRRIRGEGDGSPSPIRSPFTHVHHLAQSEALRPLFEEGMLQEAGVAREDVAFAWTFTTQNITADFEVIRSGLWGRGPLARLSDEFPPRLSRVAAINDVPDHPNPYIYPVEILVNAFNNPLLLSLLQFSQESADDLAGLYAENVAYFIFAEIQSPQFIQHEGDVFEIDRAGGAATYAPGTVYLNCAIPRERGGHTQPFPVVLYNHGSGSTRLEMLGFAGALAGFGLATCAIDSYGHGLLDNPDIQSLARTILGESGLTHLADIAFAGRSQDLNADDFKDSGGDFWTYDMFHTRDATRQTVADYFQLVRVMRHFGTERMPIDRDQNGVDDLAGDFDGDGTADIGGEQPYYMMGQSLGGIMTALASAMEPAFAAAAPVVAGAGLTDVAIRSEQTGLPEGIWLPVLGPFVLGERTPTGRVEFSFEARDVIRRADEAFALTDVDELVVGDFVELRNLDNGESDRVMVRDTPGFRLAVACDVGDRLALRLLHAGETTPFRVINTFEAPSERLQSNWFGEQILPGAELRALGDGFGFKRGTMGLRKMAGVAQIIVDPSDPANYARFYHEPLDLWPGGRRPLNVLIVNSAGDMNVPINTGLTFGRLAGLIGSESPDPRYGRTEEQVFLDAWAAEALEKLRRFQNDPCHYDTRPVLFDLDDASGGEPGQGPRLAAPALHPECTTATPALFCRACEERTPVRASVSTAWGTSGFRLMYLSPQGAHAFRLPDPTGGFDHARYQIHQIGWYFATGGQEILDEPCLAAREGCAVFQR